MNSGCLLIFLASQMLGYYLYQIKYMYEYHTVSIPILQGMYQQNLCVLRSQASSERTLLSQKIGLKVSCQIIYIDETSRVYDTRTHCTQRVAYGIVEKGCTNTSPTRSDTS